MLTAAVRKRLYELGVAALGVAAAFRWISEQDATAAAETLGSLLALLARLNVAQPAAQP